MIASLTFALVLLFPAGLTAPAQGCELDGLTETALEERALARFQAAVEEYADVHRRMERALMIDHHGSWSEEGNMESETLADVIRAARPEARAGVLFRPDVVDLFRFRIGRTLWVHRYHTADALAAAPSRWRDGVPPSVNDWWSGEEDSIPWPSLVWELPALPEELKYRIAGRLLVLIDPHANMVVDVLENALPQM